MTTGKKNTLGVAMFAALAAALPFLLTNDYYVSTLILAFLNAIIVIGLNLLLGYAGQISLGHGAFYGLAAYTTAILTTTYGWPMEAGLVAGVLLTVVTAYLIGIPTLKLSGHYLAMATLGFGLIVYIVFNESIELTGGPSGFVGVPRLELFGFAFESDLSYYFLVAGVLTLIVLLSLNLIDSRIGRAMRAIHTSEKAAEVSGIDIAAYKRFIFVLSAGYAGVAGVLYAHYLSFVAPSSFGFHFSVTLIVMVVLGGMANVWGAVAGAIFLSVLPEFLRAFEDIETLLYGGILVLGMMYLPDGIAGGITRLFKAAMARRVPHE
ncbi:branched-chain amino acid ABC transporter permease [Desulfovibrio ferrophilus]|uniref:ABC transporter permease n=1 Tax=Desulfovibrio ferrophilus TaxID=241368 RepID=A0A2Z6B3F4_9BACT|nr:branched-chain amino acid ABC transporter permease [Desulfovibrio ferrophilus]BBD10037.1 ABC transporter permease [Desulfovibrio ferrophilus]